MRWAIILRIWVIGTRSPGMAAGAGGAGLAEGAGDAIAGAGAAGGAGGGAEGLAFLQESHDVLLGDAAAQAAARHLREIHVVLTGNLAYQGRRASVVLLLM